MVVIALLKFVLDDSWIARSISGDEGHAEGSRILFTLSPVQGSVDDIVHHLTPHEPAVSGIARPCTIVTDFPKLHCRQTVVKRSRNTISVSRPATVFPANRDKLREPTSGLEPLTCSLRVSLSLVPNPTKNRRFAGTYDSAFSVEYLPMSFNIAPTADATAD